MARYVLGDDLSSIVVDTTGSIVELQSAVPLDGFQLPQSSCKPLSVKDLMDRYHSSLLSFLRQRLRVPDDAADVAQEAYIRMLQYEGSREIRSPYFLLLRVAMNVMQDQQRAGRARRFDHHRSLDDMELACNAPGPERAAVLAEEIERVLAAIDDLPPRCREVFLLHRYSALSYPQVAVRCGISVKMVEKHISAALAYCAKRTAD